ncbi:MAG: dUTP diphosphatase [Candidatus Pacearchaeota archaeon]|nr:dUTP diphosphatase [Candidatus Pacearchaeota archaeon]
MNIKIKKIHPNAQIPKYAHEGDAGMDLISVENVVIEPKHRIAVRTGLQVELPKGYEMQIRPRSGLALTKGITVLNSPGTIDSEYRGEIRVILINLGSEGYYVEKGDKIAQAVINKFEKLKIEEFKELSVTKRNEKGFGSTGK